MLKKIVFAMVFGVSVLVHAGVKPYLSINGGLGILTDTGFNVSGISGDVEFDPGYVISGTVGLTFDSISLRTELELSILKNDVDKVVFHGYGSVDGDGADQKTSTLMWNVLYDFKTESAFTPYILCGIGGADVDEDDVDTLFAFQIGAGVGYAITDHFILDLKYKFLKTDDFDFQDGSDKVNVDGYEYHQIQVGLRYQW